MQKKFVRNTLLMTATSLIIRIMSLAFRVYMVSRLGSEGIGLYQLVLTVYMFAVTVCTSGITLSVTRIVTDNSARGNEGATSKITARCMLLGLAVSTLCALAMFIFAKPIGNNFLKDARTILSLKVLAPSLPFMAVSACFRGYFYAKRNVVKPAGEQLIEQIVEMAVFFLLIGGFINKGLEYACCAVAIGTTAAEVISCIYSYICYKFEAFTISKNNELPKGFSKTLLSIFLPVTGSACLRSGLSSVENTLIPQGLRKYGSNSGKALSDYGIITGMVMPIITFPSVLLYAVATLLIPEISEASAHNHKITVQSICKRTYGLTLGFVIPITAVFIFLGKEIGVMIYSSEECGHYIAMLAPILPLMYIDSVTDGILKGLNDQVRYFTYNIIDSIIRVTLTFFLIPIMGIKGVIIVIYVSEILNTFLSVMRLIKITNLRIEVFKYILKPIFACILWGVSVKILSPFLSGVNAYLSFLLYIIILAVVYYALTDFGIKKVKIKA